MTDYLFEPSPAPALAIQGGDSFFPIHRIFCVGRNYVAHATEMGGTVDREAPWYFMKSAHSLTHSGATVPYPPGTSNFHHEIELVVAIDRPAFRVSKEDAMECVFGYATGLDMTRRDLQQVGKDNRRPWDFGKDIENGAVIAALSTKETIGDIGAQCIQLSVNRVLRQDATLADMVWSVPEIIAHLSQFYHLQAGDLIMTGTPAGVGPVEAGDIIEGHIDGLASVSLTLGAAE